MTLNLDYAISTLIVLAFFAITLAIQVRSNRYHPFAYWVVVATTTTVGATTSGFFDRTMGMGNVRSSVVLLYGVLALLYVWNRVVGKVEFEQISTKREETFYWLTILVSNTLDTTLGDFVATSLGLGFERGSLVFAGLIAVVAVAHF